MEEFQQKNTAIRWEVLGSGEVELSMTATGNMPTVTVSTKITIEQASALSAGLAAAVEAARRIRTIKPD